MNREVRIRNKSLDVELTMWKLLPLLFMVLLSILSASVIGGAAASGAAPPRAE